MRSALLFDFTVNKENQTISIKREFNAKLELVWQAWTDPGILDQWWAPKPWQTKTKYMDFKVGGKRCFVMVSPEGQEHWLIQEYTSISPKTNFKFLSVFADKNENPELPGSEWNLTFSEKHNITEVSITIFNESYERMVKLTEGFREGFKKALDNLDSFLSNKKIRKDRTVLINLPVQDIQKSMSFYSALGFQFYHHISDETAKYMVWSEHISVMLMTQEKFAGLVPKSLADTRQTMGGFYTLSVSSAEELHLIMTNGLNAGGREPNEMDNYGFMLQRTIEDPDGHCWNLLFIDKVKLQSRQTEE